MARRVLINALSLTQGGGRSYVTNVLRELERDDRGFRFTVLVSPGQLNSTVGSKLDVETAKLPASAARSRVLARVGYEEAVLPFRARRFALLYCLADLAPALRSTPTVVALRNLNIYDRRFYDTARLRILERLVRVGVRRAARVVFPSRAAVDLIRRRIGVEEAKIAVVPHGVSTEAFEDVSPVVDHPPYLFLPASLERHKNIGVLIEGLAQIEDPKLELWIAGGSTADPAYARQLERRVASLGLGSRVRFIGAVPYAEVIRYYRSAEALVFPSLLESFGHPLLEAMLAETPIVAADIPAFREIGGEVALYFPPHDAAKLAAAVERVRFNPDETALRVARGRSRAASFSWKTSVDRLCAVFEEALRT